MATEQTLIKELIRAKMINAKREKEAVLLPTTPPTADPLYQHWEGQEIMAKQLLDILEK